MKWKRLIFSDEKIFRTESNRKSVFVTRSVGEESDPACVRQSVKRGVQVHVWGLISWNGIVALKRVEGNLDGARYRQTIINDLDENLENSRIIEPIFVQDNAPAHRARATIDFLRTRGIRVLDWPGNSPDLNPIENLWADVNRRVNSALLPRNCEELWDAVLTAWQETDVALLHKLYKSLPSRVQNVIKMRGGPTRY